MQKGTVSMKLKIKKDKSVDKDKSIDNVSTFDAALEQFKKRILFSEPGSQLTIDELCQTGARLMLQGALEVEISLHLEKTKLLCDENGHRLVVKNGYLPERKILTGSGPISVKVPRVRDLSACETKSTFTSMIVPPYLRKIQRVEELLPFLYLKGVSMGDCQAVMESLLGDEAKGFSPSSVSRAKEVWIKEYQEWNNRNLVGKKYLYMWVDGIFFGVRGEKENHCAMVIIGAQEDGTKELVAIQEGLSESSESTRGLFLELQNRGLTESPKIIVADGGQGFLSAIASIYPDCRIQRCWTHKTKNVVNELPKSLHIQAKMMLKEIRIAPNRKLAEKEIGNFKKVFGAKYPKAVESLEKDKDTLFEFFNFPGAHWRHLRTNNPIESVFSTVRLRTAKTRGMSTSGTIGAMVLQLVLSAAKNWRKINESNLLQLVSQGVEFKDGNLVENDKPSKANKA
jgi:transposase-like protein